MGGTASYCACPAWLKKHTRAFLRCMIGSSHLPLAWGHLSLQYDLHVLGSDPRSVTMGAELSGAAGLPHCPVPAVQPVSPSSHPSLPGLFPGVFVGPCSQVRASDPRATSFFRCLCFREHTGICALKAGVIPQRRKVRPGDAVRLPQGHMAGHQHSLQGSPGPASSPVTKPHSPSQIYSHCPNLSPAAPLSPYGHAYVARKVSQFGVMKTGSLVGKVPEQGMPGVHRVDHGGSQLQQTHPSLGLGSHLEAKLSTESLAQGPVGPWGPAILLDVMAQPFPGNTIPPLAQHRSGPSWNTTGLQETMVQSWPHCHPGKLAAPPCPAPGPRGCTAGCPRLVKGVGQGLGWVSVRSEPWSIFSQDADECGPGASFPGMLTGMDLLGVAPSVRHPTAQQRPTSDGTFLTIRCT